MNDPITISYTAKFLVNQNNGANSIPHYSSSIQQFFKNFQHNKVKFSVSFDEVRPCTHELKLKNELYYILIHIECLNSTNDSDIENFAFAINRLWCKEAATNKHLQWLLADRTSVRSSDFDSYYSTAKVSEFAFGTTPYTNVFVQIHRFKTIHIYSSILCSFSHLERHFVVYFSGTHKPECQYKGETGNKMLIQYDSLIRIIANINPDNDDAELYFHMEHPPLLYVSYSNGDEEEPRPTTDARLSKAKSLELGSKKFQRAFEFGCGCTKTLCKSTKFGKAPVLKLKIADKFQTRWIIHQLIIKCSNRTEFCFTSVETILYNPHKIADFSTIPWSSEKIYLPENKLFICEYSWKTISSKSDVVQHQLFIEEKSKPNYQIKAARKVTEFAVKNCNAFEKALFSISELIDNGVIFSFLNALYLFFTYFSNFKESMELPPGMCYVRRVLLTPSRTIYLQPYEHFDNRIIRKFGVEFMLRASVQDDNFSKLTFAVQYISNREKVMEDLVYNVLIRGLQIGCRHYEVLASSTSQLREHGLWMYAKDLEGRSATHVRIWMGNFSGIKNVAKYMARMGQCLSSTEEGTQITLNAENEIALPDIKTRDGRYIFSDGIGSVSADLAEEIRLAYIKSAALNVNEVMFFNPTAFQIRYKGCKGMVAIDPTLPMRTIGIRPSMDKFECVTSKQLEIVKISAPRKLFLNKHLITILEQMGVPKKSFLDLQVNMIMDLLDSLIDEELAASILMDNMPVHFPFSSLSKAGIFLTWEPFFRSLLLAFFKSFADKLQTHMRIAIPERYGRNMLGILDETKTLKYGQVFVQFSRSINSPNCDMQILRGSVIVTKNPCLHPGDVRKLTAVDVPALHHLRDCIVFPAQGKRPHPDEMAGSDLDGDEFVVLWYKPLVFKRRNHEPMDYPVYTDNNLCKDKIELSDMMKFFCQYIQNDTIGTFAHAHLVWADRLQDGIFSKKCMSIAQRYPYVLDFAKHGTQEVLKKSDRPDQYPDFMQKGLHGHTYHSKKVLGSLYRVSRVLEACSSKVNLVAQSSCFDPDLAYFGWERFQTSAEKNKVHYSKLIREVLDKYGLVSEAEAFCGFVELNAWKKWKHETSNAVQVIKRYIVSIMSKFRNIFYNELAEECKKNNLNDHGRRIVSYQLASAWYMVVYGQNVERILSFPWIVSDLLVEIKQKCVKNGSEFESIASQNFYYDIDADLKLFSSDALEDGVNFLSLDSTCPCMNVFKRVIYVWIQNSGFFQVKENNACEMCISRIIEHFLKSTRTHCCSDWRSPGVPCMCDVNCSPSQLILAFLKFFVYKSEVSLGRCPSDCKGFLSRNLQELSLQTLSYLVVTRNVFYLGLKIETSNYTKSAISIKASENIFEDEGTPIKIPVNDDLKKMIEEYMDEIKTYLTKESGIKGIIIKPEQQNGKPVLIVNSLGKNWQRWNLQNILLDPEFTSKLKIVLNVT